MIDYEAAGWAYWNEERIGSTEPDKPPFDDYEKFSDIWVARARAVIEAGLGDTVLYREVVTMENHGSLPGVTASIPRTEYIQVWPEATKENP